MRLLSVIILIIALVALPGCSQIAMGAPSPDKEADAAAEEAVTILKQLVNRQNYRVMGFESLDELEIVQLGIPMGISIIRLDDLQKYEPGTDPGQLLSEVKQFIYPVEVKQEVRCSIVLAKTNGWEAVSFGNPNLTKMLTDVRKEYSEQSKVDPASLFTVRIPAMNIYFIAHEVEKELILVPVLDEPGFEMEKGAAISADKAFKILSVITRTYEDIPR